MYALTTRTGRVVLEGYQSHADAARLAREMGLQVRKMMDPICAPRSLSSVFRGV
jgi:hypothetical protein